MRPLRTSNEKQVRVRVSCQIIQGYYRGLRTVTGMGGYLI